MPLRHLLQHNKEWAAATVRERPGFFTNLSKQQSPRYMWVGCSDSRVPANQITGLEPGEVFVHRNIANVVVPTDLNALSTVQYAVDVLKVEHVIVCGHYGCGGVQAALHNKRVGLADNWIRHVQDVRDKYLGKITALPKDKQLDALCELNVIEQVVHVSQTTVMQDAWYRGAQVTIHGWVYGISDGLIKDLKISVSSAQDAMNMIDEAVDSVFRSEIKVN
jgi:carbonic anhydrase